MSTGRKTHKIFPHSYIPPLIKWVISLDQDIFNKRHLITADRKEEKQTKGHPRQSQTSISNFEDKVCII